MRCSAFSVVDCRTPHLVLLCKWTLVLRTRLVFSKTCQDDLGHLGLSTIKVKLGLVEALQRLACMKDTLARKAGISSRIDNCRDIKNEERFYCGEVTSTQAWGKTPSKEQDRDKQGLTSKSLLFFSSVRSDASNTFEHSSFSSGEGNNASLVVRSLASVKGSPMDVLPPLLDFELRNEQ
ncbi:hypothetical protein VNO78_03494 [Psophocarpus tetragonolobus]|uniref:Uncharacterized protein n=1 Tax=Psophocarpus tetragonolobus TaxID=3891 RepID=A0AAN9T4B4_PSOTE